jgi:hypothetical protein
MAGFAPRKRFENDLTNRFLKEERNWPTDVRVILEHPDFLNTLKSVPDSLKDYLINQGDEPITQLINWALLSPGVDGNARISALATRTFAQPVSAFLTDVVSCEPFKRGILAFVNRSQDWRNPVTVGHFSAIFLATARCDFSRASEVVGGIDVFLKKVLDHIDILGWQDFLALLLQDSGAEWVGSEDREKIHRGFLFLGEKVQRAADRDQWPIVNGLLNALLSFVKENAVTQLDDFVFDVDFVAALTAATFEKPNEQPLVFLTGIDLICRIVDALENPVEGAVVENGNEYLAKIQRYLAAYGAKFWRRFQLRSEDFEGEVVGEKNIVIRAFPVLWDALIEFVYPCFFHNPPVSSDFNAAFLGR